MGKKLHVYASGFFSQTYKLCLPVNPTSAEPRTLFLCKRAYEYLFDLCDFKCVWVANLNSHYSLF